MVPPAGQVVTVMVITVTVNRREAADVEAVGFAVVTGVTWVTELDVDGRMLGEDELGWALEDAEFELLEAGLADPELELELVDREELEEPVTDPEELEPELEPDTEAVEEPEELESEDREPVVLTEELLDPELELDPVVDAEELEELEVELLSPPLGWELVLDAELEVVFRPS